MGAKCFERLLALWKRGNALTMPFADSDSQRFKNKRLTLIPSVRRFVPTTNYCIILITKKNPYD